VHQCDPPQLEPILKLPRMIALILVLIFSFYYNLKGYKSIYAIELLLVLKKIKKNKKLIQIIDLQCVKYLNIFQILKIIPF
jgi:hypothetical protein